MARAAPGQKLAAVHIHLLGHLAIEIHASDSRGSPARGRVARLPTRKAESLLAYLILHPESHAREKLAALFWGDMGDAQARASLRNALAILRKHLGDGLLIATRERAQLNAEFPLWVDVWEFQKAIKTTPQDVAELYRGQLLDDFYDDWVVPEREALQRLYLDALLGLCQQMRAQGEHERTIEYGRLILRAERTNEAAYQHLMFSEAILGNRSAALELYEACRRVLESELGVEPAPETAALYQWIQRTPPGQASLRTRITTLPVPLTTFIGRRAEIEQIRDSLSSSRLLTITGAAGSGKTRLAIQAAGELVDAFRDGVWWFDLAALEDERLIPSKVARTLGIREGAGGPVTDTIIGHLRSSQALLVLDNCEHLLGACAQLITALLTSSLDLKVLVTSREALGVFGERVWLAPAMLLPEEGALLTVNDLERFDAIRLFLERAAATRPGFKLEERDAKGVVSICRKLDGIPLAIEMAAARAAALPIQEIATRLEERFSLLIAGDRVALPRQQTLRATLDWSYNLLSTEAQRLFCELSVFAGGFTVEAAERVCVTEGSGRTAVVNVLSNLVAKSLVAMETTSGDSRFRMLETIREYAREKLEMTGERNAVQRRHLDFFLALAEKSAPVGLWGAANPIWLRELAADQDNLRAALQYSSEHGLTEPYLRLCVALTWFWYIRSESIEGRNWLLQALTSSGAEPVPPSLRAQVVHNAGVFAHLQGDWKKALELLEESRSLYEPLHNVEELGWIQHDLGQVAYFQGDYSLAAQEADRGLKLFEQINNPGGVASMKLYLGLIAYYQGDNPRARSLLEESMLGLREIGDDVAEARVLHGLALVEHRQGDDARAAALFTESLRKARYKRDQLDVIKALEGLGRVACTQERAVQSTRLLGAADALRSRINYPLEPGARRENDHTVATLREKLDAAAFATAWEEGAALALEAAVELALNSGET